MYLTTTLMLIEKQQASNAVDYVSTLVHHNDCGSPQTTLDLNQRIEIHHNIITYTACMKENIHVCAVQRFFIIPD